MIDVELSQAVKFFLNPGLESAIGGLIPTEIGDIL